MIKYENIIILKGNMKEENAKKEYENILSQYFKDVKTYIKNNDVNGFLGIRNLAYKVKGNTKGYYAITYFEATEADVAEIDIQLRNNENVIKFITIRYYEDI